MRKVPKEYTLNDGSIWTAPMLARKLRITNTGARYRLDQSDKVDWVMRRQFKAMGRKKKHTCRKFTLSDNSSLSAEECAIKWNINLSTMYARLLRGIRDTKQLSKKPTQGRQHVSHVGYTPIDKQPKLVKEAIMQRNAYDPMSKLFLTMGVGA